LIKDKLENPADLTQAEIIQLMAHFIIFHFEPVANKQSTENVKNNEFRAYIKKMFDERINLEDPSLDKGEIQIIQTYLTKHELSSIDMKSFKR
jgi:hypothetical protein